MKKVFQIDPRVHIALDALTAKQKSVILPVLRDRDGFVAHSSRPGASRKLSASKPYYSMKAGKGMEIIYTVKDEEIVVQDIMRKAAMDSLATGRTKKIAAPKKRI